ncbi:MAG TPA: diguanylate cyclase [Burkholderiaceae bacterium]|jgi:diguanylate cyclase
MSTSPTPAQIAKAALLRLSKEQLEPTPENYGRAYALESGAEPPSPGAVPERAQALIGKLVSLGVGSGQVRQDMTALTRDGRWDDALKVVEKLLQTDNPSAQGEAWAQSIERMVRGLERGGKSWTVARKKDGVLRVLEGNRSDPQRLLNRLRQLVGSWDSDGSNAVDIEEEGSTGGTPSQFLSEEESAASLHGALDETGSFTPAPAASGSALGEWPAVSATFQGTVHHALNHPNGQAEGLLRELDEAQQALRRDGATPEHAAQITALCARARHLLDHREHLFGELGQLCRELSASLVDLAEDDSWARGQCEAMNLAMEQGISGRGVRQVSEMLSGTRERQSTLRNDRSRARDALKGLIQKMLHEIGELGEHTDRFQNNVGRYADAIEKADSLESLAGTVREMVEESRSVRDLVQQTQSRITLEHDRATELTAKVTQLEDELRKLSNEVQTDQLTQIANRRGLIAVFDTEQAKAEREGGTAAMALALLDIDNFKKLNDSLGHAAGDVALKSLAERVSQLLRPGDLVARYGGEEFVLLLPATPLDEAQAVLARLQRALSASLFKHEGNDVFVTFSAGVTLHRKGETLEIALDRADVALYEAKHTGKNRACIAP